MEKISVPADTNYLDRILDFVDQIISFKNMENNLILQLHLAIEEVFVNIAHYAYPDKNGMVEISAECIQDELTIIFKDRGTPFDPLSRAAPDFSIPAKERKRGGLGIYLVNKFMDDVCYYYEDEKNILILKKCISSDI